MGTHHPKGRVDESGCDERMSFDKVSKHWASAKLASLGLGDRPIREVDFDIDHPTGCYGHEVGEYCYCDTTATISVTVFFADKKKPSYVQLNEYSHYDLGGVIKELIEWE